MGVGVGTDAGEEERGCEGKGAARGRPGRRRRAGRGTNWRRAGRRTWRAGRWRGVGRGTIWRRAGRRTRRRGGGRLGGGRGEGRGGRGDGGGWGAGGGLGRGRGRGGGNGGNGGMRTGGAGGCRGNSRCPPSNVTLAVELPGYCCCSQAGPSATPCPNCRAVMGVKNSTCAARCGGDDSGKREQRDRLPNASSSQRPLAIVGVPSPACLLQQPADPLSRFCAAVRRCGRVAGGMAP